MPEHRTTTERAGRWGRLLQITSVALSLGVASCTPEDARQDAAAGRDASAQDRASSADGSVGADRRGLDSAAPDDASRTDTASLDADAGVIADGQVSYRDAGPGGLTIYDIQDTSRPAHPAADSEVALDGVVVSGVDLRPGTTGFWVQEPGGGPYSGIFVFAYIDNTFVPLEGLQVGDVVNLTGVYKEYFDLSEITLTGGNVVAAGAPPQPVSPVGIDSDAEPWEGVLVRFAPPCAVTQVRAQYGIVETSCYVLDDDIYAYSLSQGQQLSRMVGLIHYAFGEYKLLPRGPEDLGLVGGVDGGVAADARVGVDGGGGNCGSVTYQGECNGDRVRYCLDGEIVEFSCVTDYGSDATCGLLDCTGPDCEGYFCLARPGSSCAELDCDLSHGCRGGVCTTSGSCDNSYTATCTGNLLTECHSHSGLVNELDCDGPDDADPFVCGADSQGRLACLGSAGVDNCDLSLSPAAECAPGLVCSSSTGPGDCRPAPDAGSSVDTGLAGDAAVALDAGRSVDTGRVGDAAVALDAVVLDLGAQDIGAEDASAGDI